VREWAGGGAGMRLGGLTLSELHDRTRLPACFIEELLMHNFRPNTAWSSALPAAMTARQQLCAFDVVTDKLGGHVSPWVCYHTSVYFYQKGSAKELAHFDLKPRTWPNISFVERLNELWEVTGGRVFYSAGAWRWEHYCYRNTDLARHFRLACKDDTKPRDYWDCVPCRQFEVIEQYGHGNYGQCEACGAVRCLVPDRRSRITDFGFHADVMMPRHQRADGKSCEYSEIPTTFKTLEPREALALDPMLEDR